MCIKLTAKYLKLLSSVAKGTYCSCVIFQKWTEIQYNKKKNLLQSLLSSYILNTKMLDRDK